MEKKNEGHERENGHAFAIGKSRVVVLVGFENATFVWKPRSGMEKRERSSISHVTSKQLFIGLVFDQIPTVLFSP